MLGTFATEIQDHEEVNIVGFLPIEQEPRANNKR